jgi:crotonobetainyl-CoA:carnitine CoA-transferase CaiB-like acyl-CoA transferase
VSALKTFKVLELSESVAGEYCGKLLADFGADVIKIEVPLRGSPTRSIGPFSASGSAPENSGLFAYLNTNKRSVTLDLSTHNGIEKLSQMLADVDVVIDDHAPSWLSGIGLDPEQFQQAHPQLVLCAITPFGQSAPDDRRHAEDLNVMHASGWAYHTPSGADDALPPLKGPGRFLPSFEAGLEAAMCIVAALYERETSNRGQFIDVSKQQVLASRIDYVLGQMVAGDMDVRTDRTAFDLAGPAGIFRCLDGYAYIWMSAPSHWQALGKLLGEPAWMKAFPDRWLERECTAERVAECRRHIGEWLATQHKDAASAAAQKLGLTLVAVNNAKDLKASPQYQHRGFFSELHHPVLGNASYPTVPYKLGVTPAKLETHAPLLGQHNDQCPSPAGRRWRAAPDEGLPKPKLVRAGEALSPTPLPGEGKNKNRGGPLQGVRVVELTKVWAGPYTGKLLAFLGAETIRVESLGSLDVTRTYGVTDINQAPGFQAVNPQKLSVQIDMKTPQGIALLLDLLRQSDVVIENLRPGAVDRLGLGYDAVKAVNPGIVYVSMGMWGNDGPLAYQSGYAPCFAALGGVSALVGYEGGAPAGMNVRYADSTFGTAAAYAALVALMHRRRTGVGQFIDVSAVETMSSMIGDTIMDFALNGVVTEASGNRHPDMAPHGAYACRDHEWISIAVASDEAWSALAAALGQPALANDPRFKHHADRKANEAALDSLMAQSTATRDAAELTAQLQAAGVAAAKSQSSVDLVADAHLWASGFFGEVGDRAGRSRPIVGPSWKMSRGAAITDAAPQLGEHNAYVFGQVLGLSAERQQQLADAGVTR